MHVSSPVFLTATTVFSGGSSEIQPAATNLSTEKIWEKKWEDICLTASFNPFTCMCAHSRPTLCHPTGGTPRLLPLSMGFPRPEYWNELPFPPSRYLPDSGIDPTFPVSPAWPADSFTAEPSGNSFTFNNKSHFSALMVLQPDTRSCHMNCHAFLRYIYTWHG